MAWYSILPANLIYVESWAVRVFVILGLITIFPWLALIVFDMVLYICRMLVHEIPVVGGRARGLQRPRAPSLNEIPERKRMALGLDGVYAEGISAEAATIKGELKQRSVYGSEEGGDE